MRCFNCGCNLTEHDFCTNCGADVNNYKLIVSASNIYYNDGLERAKVRDLTGAVISLRQCLKLNKNHVDARNLLGLIYFEIGEGVQALNEWVISKNLRSKKNIAGDYLNLIQSNPGKLDALNAAIKKFNQALTYCYQGSLDLAVIQLKKVLSMNPRYVQAHQLLALLYLHSEEWGKAKKEVERVLKIDANNITALRYLQEIGRVLGESDSERSSRKAKNSTKEKGDKLANISEESYQYQSGNETIIQPLNAMEKKSVHSIWNVVLGIVLGIAVAWFLILPAKIQNEKAAANDELRKVGEQLDVKAATINELESKVKNLEKETENLHGQLEGFIGSGGTMEDVDHLLKATAAYFQDPTKTEEITKHLELMNPASLAEGASQSFTDLYHLLLEQVGGEMAVSFYEEGRKAYQNNDLERAVEQLKKAVTYDPKNQDAYFSLANSYRKMEKYKEATEVYEKIIELFPGTDIANRSQSYLNELSPE